MAVIRGVPLPDEGAPPLSKEEQARNLETLRKQQAAKKAKSKTMGTTKVQEDDYYTETYATGGRVRMRDGIAVRGKTRGKIY